MMMNIIIVHPTLVKLYDGRSTSCGHPISGTSAVSVACCMFNICTNLLLYTYVFGIGFVCGARRDL